MNSDFISDNVLVKYVGSNPNVVIPNTFTTIKQCSFENSLIESVLIPGSIRLIDKFAFCGCKNLKEVILSDGIEFIKPSAFRDCESLKSITIPSSVKLIDDSSFSHCGVNTINLTDGIQYIGKYSFSECNNLEEIIIPKSVKHIGFGAFSSCESLKRIIINNPNLDVRKSICFDIFDKVEIILNKED